MVSWCNIVRVEQEPILRKAKKRQYLANKSEDSKQKQIYAQKKAKRKNEKGKIVDYVTPERIIKDYREKQKSYSIYKRAVCVLVLKMQKRTFDTPRPEVKPLEGAIVFAVRVKQYSSKPIFDSGLQSATQVNKILNKLRLYQREMGVFLRMTPQVEKMIKEVEQYITYG